MTDIAQNVAIVTGASSGIGEATALSLGKEKARVMLLARRKDRLTNLAEQIKDAGGEAVPYECDVADRARVEEVVDDILRQYGRIDTLVNNAGIMPLAPMSKCRVDDWDAMIDVNVKGVLYCIGAVLPIMLEQTTGHIINVSSVAGRRLFPNGAVYCATKHAVHALSEGLRNELSTMNNESKKSGGEGENQIRVTVIAPGVVTTELPDSIQDEETREGSKYYYDSIQGPLRSHDIASAILYAMKTPPNVDLNEILIRPTAQIG